MIIEILRWYFRIILRIYYREVNVRGMEHIDTDKPLLLVSNHPNALIDAMLLITELDKDLVLTATSMLTKIPLMESIFKRVNIVLFHRRMDGHSEDVLKKNKGSIERCAEIMHEGRKLLIFPEGKSSEEGRLLRFKTGASRIAKTYVEQTGEDLEVVPIYINYSSRDRLRSTVSITFHEPLSTRKKLDEHGSQFVPDFTSDLRNVLQATEERLWEVDHQKRPRSLKFLDKVVSLPFVLFHIVPTALIYLISNLATDREDTYATIRVFASVIIFPIFYIIELILLISFLPLLWVVFLLVYIAAFFYQAFTSYVIDLGDGSQGLNQ